MSRGDHLEAQVGLLRISFAPSGHMRCLVSGSIEYQKTRPRSPLWRLVVAQADGQRAAFRVWATQPAAPAVLKAAQAALSAMPGGAGESVVMGDSSVQACEPLVAWLQRQGVSVFKPMSPANAGVAAVRSVDRFLKDLGAEARGYGERAPTPEEVLQLAGEGGACVIGWSRRADGSDRYEAIDEMAQQLCRIRGRDPAAGKSRIEGRGWLGAELHGPDRPGRTRDSLALALADLRRDAHRLTPAGETKLRLLEAVEAVRRAKGVARDGLIAVVGAIAGDWMASTSPWAVLDLTRGLGDDVGDVVSEAINRWAAAGFPVGHIWVRPFAVEVHVTSAGADVCRLQGLPAHRQIEQALARTFRFAEVFCDRRAELQYGRVLGVERVSTYQVTSTMEAVQRRLLGSGTPHSPTSALVRGEPLPQGAARIYCTARGRFQGSVALVLDRWAGAAAPASNVVNQRLQKWGAPLNVRLGRLLLLDECGRFSPAGSTNVFAGDAG